jgi:hypothetical protein
MKYTIFSALATFFILVSFGCGLSSTPSETVKNLANYIHIQKIDETVGLFSKRLILEAGGKEKITEQIRENISDKERFDKSFNGLSFEIESEVIIADSALVTTQFINDDGKIEKSTYKLIKEDGQWKIDKFL